ncbi:PrsW family intramembrane metalloprotease [Rhizohabitans arisaemae]|uniref:PrsW family intramembrane metalloprotease n=1 Tax=Rhizohabitans arisaemae TaxID=2720610 RepID=UPI0024B0B1B4|nr:PrsW family intramembrane metalloprotease [Rhizohabitans arisaemae]
MASVMDAPRAGGFLRPRRHAFWLYLIVLALGGSSIGGSLARRASEAPTGAFLLEIALYTLWLAPALWFIHRLDLFECEPLSLAAAAFVWGGLVATGLALTANTASLSFLAKVDPTFASAWGPAVAGPTTEETLKMMGVIVIVLINRNQFDRVLDGFVYGALVGLGFQFVEDMLYGLAAAAQTGESWVSAVVINFVLRGLVNGLWTHAAWTAIAGAGVACFVTRRELSRWKRVTVATCLFLVAWFLHFLNNSPLFPMLFGQESGLLTIAQVIFNGLVTLSVGVAIYRRAVKLEYGWFAEVVRDDIGNALISEAEVAELATNGSRRRAVRRAAIRGGRRAARLQRQLQQAQIAYGVAKARRRESAVIEERQLIEEIKKEIREFGRRG